MNAVKFNGLNDLTPETLIKRIESYFSHKDQHSKTYLDAKGVRRKELKPYSIEGLMIFLGLKESEFDNLMKDPAYEPILYYAKRKVLLNIVDNAMCNNYNAIFAMFYLKNRFDFYDRIQHELSDEGKKQLDAQQKISNDLAGVLKFSRSAEPEPVDAVFEVVDKEK